MVRELDDFEWSAPSSLEPRQIRELATRRWIAHGCTAMLLGSPGTGKAHLAVSVGLEAVRQNYSVQSVTAATLVAMLAMARGDSALDKQLSLPSACPSLPCLVDLLLTWAGGKGIPRAISGAGY